MSIYYLLVSLGTIPRVFTLGMEELTMFKIGENRREWNKNESEK